MSLSLPTQFLLLELQGNTLQAFRELSEDRSLLFGCKLSGEVGLLYFESEDGPPGEGERTGVQCFLNLYTTLERHVSLCMCTLCI